MLATGVQTVCGLFEARVAASGDRESYRTKSDGVWTSVTWRALQERVHQVCAALVDLGLERADRVAILGPCCPTWTEADLGAVLAGAATVGIYETLLLDQIQFLLEDARVRVLFVHSDEQLERVRPLLDAVDGLEWIVAWDAAVQGDRELAYEGFVERGAAVLAKDPSCAADRARSVEPADVAVVVYTSGTTGRPKGVPLDHGCIISWLAATQGLLSDPMSDDDITLSFLPLAHVAEHVAGLFGRMNIGLPTAYATSYDTLLDELVEVRPTYFGAVPRIFEKMYGRIRERVADANPRRQAIFRWAQALARRRARALTGGPPLALSDRLQVRVADLLVYRKLRDVFGGRVKYFLTGSAPIDIEILEFFTGCGLTILEVYGLSESCAIAFANTVHDCRLGTVGRAIPGVQVRIADDGEILLKGRSVFKGYLDLPDATAEAFDDDGYFATGDIGVLDADGFLRITDRKKNLIKTAGGKYVVPARLQALVQEEPAVSQVYVHGDRRPYVVALITLDEREVPRLSEELGVSEAEVASHPSVTARVERAVERANGRLARFEQIKKFAVLPEDFSIETGTVTPTLKIKRKAVEERYGVQLDALYGAAP